MLLMRASWIIVRCFIALSPAVQMVSVEKHCANGRPSGRVEKEFLCPWRHNRYRVYASRGTSRYSSTAQVRGRGGRCAVPDTLQDHTGAHLRSFPGRSDPASRRPALPALRCLPIRALPCQSCPVPCSPHHLLDQFSSTISQASSSIPLRTHPRL